MNMTEKTLTQEYRFQGRIMAARYDTVLLPNGRTAAREICEHLDGVGVLPIDSDGTVYLVRQFRYPYGIEMLEIPAGKMDQGAEEAEACGMRELQEETGFTAGRIVDLGEMYPSPGFMTETLHLYCALDLHAGEKQPDEDEFVETVQIPFSELEKRIALGDIRDAKTIAAVCKARLLGLVP